MVCSGKIISKYFLCYNKFICNLKLKLQRNSFVSIEQKNHPNVASSVFDFEESIASPDSIDFSIAEEIVSEVLRQESTSLNSGTGEWSWLQDHRQKKYISILERENVSGLANSLAGMFRNDATYGYLSPSFLDVLENCELVKSDILNNIDACIEFGCLSNLLDIATPLGVGAPYGLSVEGGIVLPDSPRHYYYSSIIKKKLAGIQKPTVVEIGGGYGGLCRMLMNNIKNCTVCNIDLFPALSVSYYFLKKLGVDVVFIDNINDIKSGKVNLLSADKFSHSSSPDVEIDLIFNSRSMCEMDEKTCFEYVQFVNTSGAKYFYHENSNFLLFPNSERHLEVLGDFFGVDEKIYSLDWKSITPFTGGQGRYREYFYVNMLGHEARSCQ